MGGGDLEVLGEGVCLLLRSIEAEVVFGLEAIEAMVEKVEVGVALEARLLAGEDAWCLEVTGLFSARS